MKRGMTIWLTGLSGAGKTTIARALANELRQTGATVEILDGDEIRKTIGNTLGFSKDDRDENIRRISVLALAQTITGAISIVSVISPYRNARDNARKTIGSFIEVYVNAPLEICEQRDTKDLYRRARSGEIANFTGVSDPYEAPLHHEIECKTDRETIEESVSKILHYLHTEKLL
jgi:adenylylsulfate kinase